MDVERICSLFQSSLDPELQKDAEAALDTVKFFFSELCHLVLIFCLFQIFKIIDFAPSILKVVTNDQVQHATRQAGNVIVYK